MQKTLALLLMVAVSVLTLGAQAPADIPKLDVEKDTLANGLEVILSEDHRVPLVGVDVWYHVGPAHEAPGRTGFAHLFEHMMFQGSKHIESDAHFRLLAGAGATGSTARRTSIALTTSRRCRPISWSWRLARVRSHGLPARDRRSGQARRTSRTSSGTSAARVPKTAPTASSTRRCSSAVSEGNPYHGIVIGSHADIQAAKLEDVREFFRQYYAPNNATIAIAGDIDKAATKKLIEKYFGSLKRGPPFLRST